MEENSGRGSGWKNFFNATCSALKRLPGWKQGDEDEKWAKRAAECIMKKLMTDKNKYHDLNYALTNKTDRSKCVPIETSADGRIQVNHRKSLPHVICCRVWRWSDLQSHHELESVENCSFPFCVKSPAVCINPFHYRRVNYSVLPPVLVPRYNEEAPIVNCGNGNGNASFNYAEQNYNKIAPSPENIVLPNTSSFQSFFNEVDGPSSNNLFQPISVANNASSSGSGRNTPEDVRSIDQKKNASPVYYQEPQNWAKIVYFEQNHRVGAAYQCSSPFVIVDGFTNPNQTLGNRFSLGTLSNVNRNTNIENTRRRIGKGIQLTYTNGEVHIKCLSDYSVYVQSKNFNLSQGFHVDAICKLQPGCGLRLFNNRDFSNRLLQSVNLGANAVFDLIQLCTIRISFVKGWGAEYQRRDITSTPCWIEISLHGPLEWLDKVLNKMGSPNNPISSVS